MTLRAPRYERLYTYHTKISINTKEMGLYIKSRLALWKK